MSEEVERFLRYGMGYGTIARFVTRNLDNKLREALKGTILGTIRTRATPIEREVGDNWKNRFLQIPKIKTIQEVENFANEAFYFKEQVPLEILKPFPYAICSGIVFNRMTSKEVRALLDEHVGEIFPGKKTDYQYTGRFCVEFGEDSLLVRAGGSINRFGAKYIVSAFDTNQETVDWINGVVKQYYTIMSAITEKGK